MIITKENIFGAHEQTLGLVYDNDYYVNIIDRVMECRGSPETEKDIVYFWQEVWERLPDSTAIRRNPFYEICDIAEMIYDIDTFDG
jgi:hypothetical protein